MTLNVSLIVPDGIVIASDSLMTISRPITQKMNVDSICPKCSERVEIRDVQVPPVSVPSTTFPYAQKIFDIKGKFALAVYGSAFVNSRSMFSQVLSLSAKLPEKSENEAEDYLGVIAEQIKTYFDCQLKLDWQKNGINVAMLPDTWFPFGFQLAGIAKDATGDAPPWSCGPTPVARTAPGIATKLHCSTPRRPGLDSACLLARRAGKLPRPPARLTASGQTASRKTGLPQDPARPAPPTAALAPSVAPFRQQSFVAPPN